MAAVIDAAGLNSAVLPAIRDGGVIVAVRGWTEDPPPRGITPHAVWVSESVRDQALLQRIADYLERGVIVPRVAEVLPAAAAADAHRRLAAGGLRGRLVLDLTTL